MDPISNVDRLVLLLRQRLLERSRSAPSSRKDASRSAGERAATGPEHLHALAAVEGVDDRQLKRALIQNVLAEQLGARLVNEAKFQQVVDRVTDAIDADGASSGLLSRLVSELRASAR